MNLTLQPDGHSLQTLPGERILDALRRLGFDAPQSCRNGNCHVCAARLLCGQVRQGEETLSSGEIYTCLAEPLEDCELHWEGILAPGELPLRNLACQLIDCHDIGGDVWRLQLRTPAGKPLRYHAGQYLLLERNDGEVSAFSIASSADQERILELHILRREQSAIALLEQLQRDKLIRIRAPLGDCHLAGQTPRPLLLIAAGTGLAQMQSVIQHALKQGFEQPIHLYWGVREDTDFYRPPYWEHWQEQPNLYLQQVVSDQADWPGRQGLLHQAVCEDIANLADYQCLISGSPAMVYATFDALVAAGMPADQIQSDVFAYAPRGA